MASRYNLYDSRSSTTSSHFSDPSSSTEFNYNPPTKTASSSRALVKTKIKPSNDHHPHNLTSMVKKFMGNKKPILGKGSSSGKGSSAAAGLVIPCDLIAEDLKKTARRGTSFSGLQKKLFGKEKENEKKAVKALTEVKGNVNNSGNTRTLAMVLRSERELLSANKEQDMEIAELKLMLEAKNREVEKLKDLCLKQREEIKSLKSAVLFPEVMNPQVQELLEKQGSELKQAKQLIPTLQRQVTSLTDQLQFLAEDLAEVKADKYTRAYTQHHSSSPETPTYDHEEATKSLDFSSCDAASPGSPDNMFLKDFNPCLTPYYAKTKSQEFEAIGYDSPLEKSLSKENIQKLSSRIRKMSRSSDCYQSNNNARSATAACRPDGSKSTYGKQMHLRYI